MKIVDESSRPARAQHSPVQQWRPACERVLKKRFREREREMEERKREVRFIVAGRLKRVVGDADEFIDATRRLELCELGEPRFTFAFCTKILLRLRASPGLFQGTTAPGGRSTEESSEGRLAFNRRVVATHCYSRLLPYLDSDKLPNFRHGLLFPSLL